MAAAIAAGLFSMSPDFAWAANINVGADQCTLANAIGNANGDTDGDGASGCVAGSGADVIVLPASSTQTLTAALPEIASVITVKGNGSTVLRPADAPVFRIFTVARSGHLRIQNTTISGGSANLSGGGILNIGTLSVSNSTVSGNAVSLYNPGSNGGGISNLVGGTATLTNSRVSGNVALDGGGIDNRGVVSLTRSTVSGNSAFFSGGGIDNNLGEGIQGEGTVSVTRSTVTGNSAGFGGGGISNIGRGTVTVVNSAISGNTAYLPGGGLYNRGTMMVSASTVSGNTGDKGGGVASQGYATLAADGSLVIFPGTLTLTNSTLSGNTALFRGGGIYNFFDTVSLTNSTVTGNRALAICGGVYTRTSAVDSGFLTLTRSLVSGNMVDPAGSQLGIELCAYLNGELPAVLIVADDFNLFGHAGLTDAQAFVGFTPGASDLKATSDGIDTPLSNILETTLADNGGPTQTHALVAGSPAIDAAGTTCEATDQRGVIRPQGAACDIGAFELGPALPELRFAVSNESVTESDGRLRVGLRLSQASASDVSVTLRFGGSAERGVDYTAPRRITIPAGSRGANIPIRLVDDALPERRETIFVDLGRVTGASAGRRVRHTIRIAGSD